MTQGEKSLPVLPARHDGCCSCGLCEAVCPRKAIRMRLSEEGFMRPHVDAALCVGCHACEKACGKKTRMQECFPGFPKCYAAYATDNKLRYACSSGGVLSLLAKEVIAQGGVVFGVVMTGTASAKYTMATHQDDLLAMQGSKYIQADTTGVFERLADVLKTGQTILFTGLPCYIKSLRARFGYGNANLLTADIACYGIPSQLALKSWIDGMEKERGVPVRRIHFRDKTKGWRSYKMKVEYADSRCEVVETANWFHELFLSRLCLNDSCYSCEKDYTTHFSDFTVGDFWGGGFSPEDEHAGVSSLICHTERGLSFLEQLGAKIKLTPVTGEDVERGNQGMRSVRQGVPWQRERVLHELKDGEIQKVCRRYLFLGSLHRDSLVFCRHRMLLPVLVCRVLRKLKRMLHS